MSASDLLRVISLSSVLLTAMAFSCQDHNVPDPEPVANCKRIDGTDRALPCEFEITKLEFLRNNTNNVVRTFLPGDSTIGLPINASLRYVWGSMHAGLQMTYRMRVYVKRIAPASFQPVGGYEIQPYQLSPSGPPGDPLPPIWDDLIGGPYGLNPPAATANDPLDMSMAVGETRSYVTTLDLMYNVEYLQGQYFGHLMIGIINNTTALTLLAPPYNYNRLRDIHETRIAVKPNLDCEPGANCY
ncbi:hypothetical protein [Dyadobacter sp. OTU695]|uniref:hypothetical protein n=1 Tax=Dyadobacter sp. OTU695 TaxID=3043860 RepID=UPI00313DB538